MPYPNEHAARIKDPGQYERIRRVNDEFGEGIDAIYGIKDSSAELQAIRFDKDKYTVAEARKWLSDNNYKPIEFEPSSGSSDNSESFSMNDKDFQYEGEIEIEAFKAGVHTDSAGNTHTWTEEDVQEIADKYNIAVSQDNPNRREAPVVIGHPKDNSPAFGWIKGAKKVKDKLVLTLGDLNEKFVKALKENAYKFRSISLFQDNTIRHIGFLGGAQPAVPGLGPINWSTTEENIVTFEFSNESVTTDESHEELERENKFFKRLFKRFKYDLNEEKLNKNTNNNPPEDEMSEEKITVEGLEAKITELSEQITEKDDTIKSLNNQIKEFENKSRKAEYRAFCDRLVSEGKMLPKHIDMNLENMELRYQADAANFSDSSQELTSLNAYKKSLEESEKIVDLNNETATNDKASDKKGSADFEAKIDEKVNSGLSYGDAYNAVANENPELYEDYISNND